MSRRGATWSEVGAALCVSGGRARQIALWFELRVPAGYSMERAEAVEIAETIMLRRDERPFFGLYPSERRRVVLECGLLRLFRAAVALKKGLL